MSEGRSPWRRSAELGLKDGREQGLKGGREQGLKDGREQGLKDGREQGLKDGREQGLKDGQQKALRFALEGLCTVLGIELTQERMRHLDSLDADGLSALFAHLQERRAWPLGA
ncbi:MAG: hypothetical protein R3F14_16190 [Polyangiaceae bacterium]